MRRGVLGMIIADGENQDGNPRRTPDAILDETDIDDLEPGDQRGVEQHHPDAREALGMSVEVNESDEEEHRQRDGRRGGVEHERGRGRLYANHHWQNQGVHHQAERPHERGHAAEEDDAARLLGEDIVGEPSRPWA